MVTIAEATVKGLDDINEMFADLYPIPESVVKDALTAMAKVGEQAVKATGESLGVRDENNKTANHILDKIKHSKPRKTKDGGVTNVTFSGTRTRGRTKTRNAEIAFVNEYGKRGQAPRPFIRLAAEKSGDKIAEAGEKVIIDWWGKTTK